MSPEHSLAKKILDKVLAGFALVLFSPLLAILALLIYMRLGPPVLFRQVRPGLDTQPFTIYKFRTMRDAVNNKGRSLTDKERLVSLGVLMRRTSLDELPELFNVLKGDMSLVGPRPLLMQYLPYYTQRENLRNTVKPGITGWAQINGRNQLPWNERLEMDAWYVENWSMSLDLKILAMTVYKVIKRDGAVADSYELEEDLNKERQLRAR